MVSGLLDGPPSPAFKGGVLAVSSFLILLLTACTVGPPAQVDRLALPSAPAPVPMDEEPMDMAGIASGTTTPTPGLSGSRPGSALPPPTYTPMIPPTPGPTDTPRSKPTTGVNSPTASPEPYAGLLIADLIRRDYGGGALDIVDTLEVTDSFTRYLITYPSDGLTIYGFMNVPNEGSRFPVVIALHGYIEAAAYKTLDYTKRYADELAEAGYFVIHPNLRGFPPSDEGDSAYRVGLAVDVLNLIAIVREQSQDPTGYLRRADADDINLWGHSMGGGVVLRVITVDNSPYIRAAVLYGAMSGDERRNYEKILQWSDGEVGEFELAAPLALLKAISPIYHLDRINAPLAVHHGLADDVVPPEWSADLCQRLEGLQQPVECHTYPAMPHTFHGANDQLFMERVVDFYDRH
jgi:dienelactone hydrolase